MSSVIPELECKCCMLQEYSGTTESTVGGLGVAAVRGTPFLQGRRPGSEQYCLGRMSSVIPEPELGGQHLPRMQWNDRTCGASFSSIEGP